MYLARVKSFAPDSRYDIQVSIIRLTHWTCGCCCISCANLLCTKQGSKERRGKRRSTSLRKHQSIEHVVVEESFSLLSRDKEKAGEGIYVSATTSNNKRFYGLLVEQSALKEASALWFQDQANSLELNRRIKVLKQQQESETTTIQNGSQKSDFEETILERPTIAQSHTADANSNNASDNSNEQIKRPAVATESASIASDVQSIPNQAADFPNTSAHLNGAPAKRPIQPTDTQDHQTKRAKLTPSPVPSSTVAISNREQNDSSSPIPAIYNQPVQKFRYILDKKKGVSQGGESKADPGYRVLVATYSSIQEAAGWDDTIAKAIATACQEGGNYLPGDATYYYQFEVLPSALTTNHAKRAEFDIRTSMGFHQFLQNTSLPPWFPLSNLHTRQTQVLNMLNMKRDNNGNLTWETTPDAQVSGDTATVTAATALAGGTRIPMQPRKQSQYHIGVIGGGIAGVACCQELLKILRMAGIDAHVTLFEARKRLGGRLWTDRTFLPSSDGDVSIELGASWIHGIEDNPLAALAREAGIDFVTASEEVQMLGKDLKHVDPDMDERTGQLFDDLLDHAADDCWSAPDNVNVAEGANGMDLQSAVRWYASVFARGHRQEGVANDPNSNCPQPMPAPPHRRSSDWSIDTGIGKAISRHKLREISRLSEDEHRMLLWNTKNIEYALGANISDLSMKYWDADDRHAFEGDHVLLKQGFSKVIDHMMESLRKAGNQNFEVELDFPVGKVEYGRKSTTQPYGGSGSSRKQKLVELSDTCSVTSQDGTRTKFCDFLVCACPLGVLKESVAMESSDNNLSFEPPLPFSKIDAITNVGFGLLDKVYLQFPRAFWRKDAIFKANDQCLFGNISGVNPHHYMFFDIGRCLGPADGAPAILMSLVSGQEAVKCEHMSDREIAAEVVSTLRAIFPGDNAVPEPTAFRFTRWGQDKYSRGSYTFLPPGATDQDFQVLQSPINANGDSLLLEGSETMRLFFAGEHTTALHPSMAHGAMLSGMRAAKEVVSSLLFKHDEDKDIDRVIPLALFRHTNPTAELECSLCHKTGGRVREGSLIAFKKGARQVLAHNNCAEYSPEVEVLDFKWKNVIKAVNRGKSINCSLCKGSGATIGCSAERCFRVFHFSCSEDAGWRFERDGKIFYCELHRKLAPDYTSHCDRVSIKYYLTKNLTSSLKCHLCGGVEASEELGQLLAFQYGNRRACVHEKCIKFTTICDTSEVEASRMGHEYKNVFRAIDESRPCSVCTRRGATICCTEPSCSITIHLQCAIASGWHFGKRGKLFLCKNHRTKKVDKHPATPATLQHELGATAISTGDGIQLPNFLSHNLLARLGAAPVGGSKASVPGNLDIGGTSVPIDTIGVAPEPAETDDSSDSDDSAMNFHDDDTEIVLDLVLSNCVSGTKRNVHVSRASSNDPWQMSVKVTKLNNRYVLVVADSSIFESTSEGSQTLQVNDVIVSMNGITIGTGNLRTLRDIMSNCLKKETDLHIEAISTPIVSNQW